ncbi:hypothetical protein COV93_03640 [Candidatus Woesearchaeota archaeon CG11_big_fil_rev_8_21_14_0_20_43_8]|nr:MAG: hypothetical protein COV93_03640 [Candidatus Woesearchaeota archaeon CG11_big_fil_rev_8_21_14_0_20_43_8]
MMAMSEAAIRVIPYFSAIFIASMVGGFICLRNYLIMRDIPTSKIRGIAMGLVELKGKVARMAKPITAPFSGLKCSHCMYSIKQCFFMGKTHYWKTLNEGKNPFFYLRDDTGKVKIDTDGVEFNRLPSRIYRVPKKMHEEKLKPEKFLDEWNQHYSRALKMPKLPISILQEDTLFPGEKHGDYRYYEYTLEPGDELYVLGTASMDKKSPGETVIKKGKNHSAFMMSKEPEESLTQGSRTMMIFLFFLAIASGMILAAQLFMLFSG